MLDQFKDLFGRFQNLNLINLKIDLEQGKVPMGIWIFNVAGCGPVTLCPMAHGIDCFVEGPALLEHRFIRESRWKSRGWPAEDIYEFAHWWDGHSYLGGEEKERKQRLTQLINSMWKERLDDAVSVQEILEQEPLVEELPCSLNVPTPLVNR